MQLAGSVRMCRVNAWRPVAQVTRVNQEIIELNQLLEIALLWVDLTQYDGYAKATFDWRVEDSIPSVGSR
jgi:hypothetical protein